MTRSAPTYCPSTTSAGHSPISAVSAVNVWTGPFAVTDRSGCGKKAAPESLFQSGKFAGLVGLPAEGAKGL